MDFLERGVPRIPLQKEGRNGNKGNWSEEEVCTNLQGTRGDKGAEAVGRPWQGSDSGKDEAPALACERGVVAGHQCGSSSAPSSSKPYIGRDVPPPKPG